MLDSAQLPGPQLVELPPGSVCVVEDGAALPMQGTDAGVQVEQPCRPALSARLLTDASGAPEIKDPATAHQMGAVTVLKNDHLRIEIADSGMLSSLLDKRVNRQVLPPSTLGNRLELIEDWPVSCGAWGIDIFFEDRGELLGRLTRIDIIEDAPLRATVEIERAFRQSRIIQRFSITRASARIDFHTWVDWHEMRLLLKGAFPVTIRARRANFDIQWGQIDRPTHRNTSRDAAQFEVPAQKGGADLSEGAFGVALLNECTYGYDVRGVILRLFEAHNTRGPVRIVLHA